MCGQCDAVNAVRWAAEKEAKKIERQRKKTLANQANLPNTLSATTSIFSLSESLGIDANALVNACETAGTSQSLLHLADVDVASVRLREFAVSKLRADKRSWAYIAARLGMTPQAAHKRFRYVDAK